MNVSISRFGAIALAVSVIASSFAGVGTVYATNGSSKSHSESHSVSHHKDNDDKDSDHKDTDHKTGTKNDKCKSEGKSTNTHPTPTKPTKPTTPPAPTKPVVKKDVPVAATAPTVATIKTPAPASTVDSPVVTELPHTGSFALRTVVVAVTAAVAVYAMVYLAQTKKFFN